MVMGKVDFSRISVTIQSTEWRAHFIDLSWPFLKNKTTPNRGLVHAMKVLWPFGHVDLNFFMWINWYIQLICRSVIGTYILDFLQLLYLSIVFKIYLWFILYAYSALCGIYWTRKKNSKFSVSNNLFDIPYVNLCFYILWNLRNVNLCIND